MNLKNLRFNSLKTRVTLVTLVIFLFGFMSLACYWNRMLREDMERLLGQQQYSTASMMAAEVNNEMEFRLKSIEMIAGSIHYDQFKKFGAYSRRAAASADFYQPVQWRGIYCRSSRYRDLGFSTSAWPDWHQLQGQRRCFACAK